MMRMMPIWADFRTLSLISYYGHLCLHELDLCTIYDYVGLVCIMTMYDLYVTCVCMTYNVLCYLHVMEVRLSPKK